MEFSASKKSNLESRGEMGPSRLSFHLDHSHAHFVQCYVSFAAHNKKLKLIKADGSRDVATNFGVFLGHRKYNHLISMSGSQAILFLVVYD